MGAGLTEMAAQIQGLEDDEDRTLAAAVLQEEGIPATSERLQRALEDGGRAAVTVRSHKTRRHVKVVLVARKKKEGGQGWVPRNTCAGRVGTEEADCIEARDPDLEYPDNYVGRLYLDTGEWRAGRDADPARAWTAQKAIQFAKGRFDLLAVADVYLAAECSYCGKTLTDPVSIERGVGPECYGRHTGSRLAERS